MAYNDNVTKGDLNTGFDSLRHELKGDMSVLRDYLIELIHFKTFAVSVFPRAAWFYVQGSRLQITQPLAQFLGDELQASIRTNVFRDPSPQHQL